MDIPLQTDLIMGPKTVAIMSTALGSSSFCPDDICALLAGVKINGAFLMGFCAAELGQSAL